MKVRILHNAALTMRHNARTMKNSFKSPTSASLNHHLRLAPLAFGCFLAVALLTGCGDGQQRQAHDHDHDHDDHHGHTHGQATAAAPAGPASAPYTLDTCPVSGEALGSMGEPVVYSHEGREIRFCCQACVEPFEKEPAKYLQAVDAAMIEQQRPDYPLQTCVISAMRLGSMGEPYPYIYRNHLVLFCCEGCIPAFRRDPATHLAKIERARNP
jgi:YHS domain-containing protein